MGGGSISYNERALSEFELILKFPGVEAYFAFPTIHIFRFPGNSIPSTVRCDARMPSSELRPSACGFRFAKRTTTHHSRSYDIDPMDEDHVGASQRGGNSASVRGRFPLRYPVMHDFVIIPIDIAHEHGFDGSVFVIATAGIRRLPTDQTRTRTLKLYGRGNTFDTRA